MRIAIIGLGSIATRAYLPVLTASPGIIPVLVSRRRETVDAVADRYGIGLQDRFTSLAQAIGSGLDAATVHAPTEAQWPDRDVLTLQRHRPHPLGSLRSTVFESFIHVVDTLRFLVPSSLDDLVIAVGRGPGGRWTGGCVGSKGWSTGHWARVVSTAATISSTTSSRETSPVSMTRS